MRRVLLEEKNGGIVTLTLNRPEVFNALSEQLIASLITALRSADGNQDIGAIIITGAGKAFSTGGDLDEIIELAEGLPDKRRAYLSLFKEMIETIREVSRPVIAAVNGFCIGGGNEVNLACDLSIASEEAKFGQAGAKVGSAPLIGGTQLLPGVVGEKKSKEMIFLCRTYDAEEALRMGLVNIVVPAHRLMEEAKTWAMEILEKSPAAIKIAKGAHNKTLEQLKGAMEEGVDILTHFWGTDEAREGFRAFREKRKPDFKKYHTKK